MDLIAQLTQLAYDGDYDEQYESLVRCGIQAADMNIETSVVPVEGFQNQ